MVHYSQEKALQSFFNDGCAILPDKQEDIANHLYNQFFEF